MLYNILVSMARFIFNLVFKINIHGENILPQGRLVICANHFSMIDPIVIAISCNRKINFIGKKELFKNKLLAYFFNKLGVIPIDRKTADIKAIKNAINILKREEVLGIFPEGTRVKNISMDNMKEGIGMIANRADADILPVQIITSYKLFSKLDIFFRPIIKLEDFKTKYLEDGNDKNKLNSKIAEEVFLRIYGE